jgi:uncharacterized membrane-anchored protein YjiN (DUF445 family)
MLTPTGPVPASPDTDRAHALRRIQRVATLLLVAMALLLLATLLMPGKLVWVGFVRAFAEAAVVGACADWFAVTALFRHPFGLPIPHTAIVARNKDRIGRGMGRFIAENFLAESVLAERLEHIDPAAWISAHLGDAEAARGLARRIAPVATDLLSSLPNAAIGELIGTALRRGAEAVPASPTAGRILSALREEGEIAAFYDRGLSIAETWVVENEAMIRRKVEENTARWIPGWVDKLLGDKVMAGLLSTLGEARAPDHAWRGAWDVWFATFAEELASDEDLRAKGETLKTRLLDSPRLHDEARSLWRDLVARWAETPDAIAGGLESVLGAVGARLHEDADAREALNRWLRAMVLKAIAPRGPEIAAFVTQVVERWDADTVVERLELSVGRDLQYIRINGTIVGGLVGVVLHAVALVV